MFSPKDFLDLDHTEHRMLFENVTNAWDALKQITSYLQFRLKLARERDVVPTRKGGGASLDALIGAQSSGTVRNPAGMLWQTGAQRLEAPVRASAPAAPSKATDLDDDLAALGKGLGKIKVRPSKD